MYFLSGFPAYCDQLVRITLNCYFFTQPTRVDGNDRFEGFAIDMMDAIAGILDFRIKYKLCTDDTVSELCISNTAFVIILHTVCGGIILKALFQ